MKRHMMSIVLMIVAGIAGVTTAHAQGRDRSPTQFGEDTPIVLRPDRAYIFYRTPSRTTFRFVREPTDQQISDHAARRAQALATARTRAERRIVSWERGRSICPPNSRDHRCREPRPQIPDEASFEFPSIYEGNFAGNAYRPRLLHDDAWSGWLIAVEPGTYALYGEFIETPNGTAGVCYCMGSVKFDAPAGQITDMGEIVLLPEAQRGNADLENFRLGHSVSVAPWAPTMRSPAQFASLRVVPAQLRPADRMLNHFGVPITRLGPIEGVLGYERDRVIDPRATGAAAAAGGGVQR